jgi:hypothetical protein
MQKEIDKEFNDTISDLTKTFMYDAFFFLSKDRTQLQILGVQQTSRLGLPQLLYPNS